MKKVENALVKDGDILKIGVSYTDKGKDVKYGRASVGIVKSPYTGEFELAVKPYYKNRYGEWVQLYSFEDDLQYNECMRIISDCEFSGKPIPTDVEAFVKEMIGKKNYARKQANATVESATGERNIETGYAMNKWRDDLVSSADAQKLLEDYKESHQESETKTTTKTTRTSTKSSGKVQ